MMMMFVVMSDFNNVRMAMTLMMVMASNGFASDDAILMFYKQTKLLNY